MEDKMDLSHKFVIGIAILALFGTVTNYIYVSPLLTILLPLCLFAANKKSLPRPIFWLYLFAVLFVASTLLYNWHSFFTFGYYRRDGNFIIAYSPLFLLPLFTLKIELKKYIRYFYLFVLVFYVILFIHYFAKHGILSLVTNYFFGLFYAHNAAGEFFAIIASLGFAYAYNKEQKKEWLFFLVVFIILVFTRSRGSVLGLLAGIVAWYCCITKRFKLLISIVLIPVFLTVISIMIGYPYFKNKINTHKQVYYSNISKIQTSKANILIRLFYTYPRAWYLFAHSPLVGTGVGSYNDRPLQLKKIAPFIEYNSQPHHSYNSRTAHNTYLNILAEQGIVGLVLFLIFWVSLFWYIMRIRGDPLMRDFLLIAYFSNTFVAFTGHRLTTPSNMLPFAIILGLYMAQKKPVKTYIIKKISA
jgi:O-antigen ligase